MPRRLVAVLVLIITGATPALADGPGILILAPNGPEDWNAQVKDLAARTNAQRPTELALGTPARETIQAAIDRLVSRGATDVTVVPFFLPDTLSSELSTKYSVSLRFAAAPAADPMMADVFLSRAEAISHNPPEEVIVLLGSGGDDNGAAWSTNLSSVAQRLNQLRRFSSILLIKSASTAAEQQQVRRLIDGLAGPQRRLLVVPLLTPPSGGDRNLAQCLQGYAYEVAASGAISDGRLVNWLLARAAGQ